VPAPPHPATTSAPVTRIAAPGRLMASMWFTAHRLAPSPLRHLKKP
jgi:hypothetical protein